MALVICGECKDPIDGIGSHPKCRDRACAAQMKREGRAI